MKSIWDLTSEKVSFPPLEGDKRCDILIVGGGMAGVLLAYMLKRAGVECLLVEAERIGNGTTGSTTAKITVQHKLQLSRTLEYYGAEFASLYAEAQIKAFEEYEHLCRDIDCDYEVCDSYVYTRNNKRAIERELAAYEKIGLGVEYTESTELPFEVSGALRMRNQARFNPLKFLYSIAEGLNIAENTRVLRVEGNVAVTEKGKITAEKIVIATHFPIINNKGFYFLKMYQQRSYVLALEGAARYKGMYVEDTENGMSMRCYGDVLLLGGGGHRSGKNGGGWRELLEFKEIYYPSSNEICRFAAQDCITLDGLPYVGKYSSLNKNLFVATGFNKWGMTSSMAAAMLLCDLVRERSSDYSAVFSPGRMPIIGNLLKNIGSSALSLIRPTSPRCSHLGCALKYNKAEHTWDCPCHGSRFDSDGKVIESPAIHDIKSGKCK